MFQTWTLTRRSQDMRGKQDSTPEPGVATVLSAGTRATGELHSTEDVVLVGSFEGKLRIERSLRVMPEARIDGEVQAERILVLGTTDGLLHATQRIEMRAGAVVSGEVVAPQIRMQEGVILNARVHMSGPPGPSRHYLLPTYLRIYDDATPQELEEAEQATEKFLRQHGFELEARAEHADASGALRPIFRSRDALNYRTLRERLSRVESALRAATESSAGPGASESPLQGTGSAGAAEVVQALSRLRRAALAVGPVAMTRLDENPGERHLALRLPPSPLPEGTAGESPDPGSLLVSLQKLQREILHDLE
jgi:cytoskeletal protein CcmA (bactofilin family)